MDILTQFDSKVKGNLPPDFRLSLYYSENFVLRQGAPIFDGYVEISSRPFDGCFGLYDTAEAFLYFQ